MAVTAVGCTVSAVVVVAIVIMVWNLITTILRVAHRNTVNSLRTVIIVATLKM